MQPLNQNNNFLFQSVFEALEERVLFDGVPDAAFVLPADAAANVPAQVQNLHQSDVDVPRELIVVDPGVENSDALLAEILENRNGSAFEIRMLDADSDGVQQITDLLAQSNGKYDAIHVISHGDDGQINLGNAQLTSESFSGYVDQLASWSSALTDDADLLFYGCDLAANADGQSLVESISAVTGADVAASDDVTGHESIGGDWELEIATGHIQTQSLTAVKWQGGLAVIAAQLNIISDGTPTFDADDNAGNDSSGTNGIIRSHDTIAMEVFYNTDPGGAQDLKFETILPDGLVWDALPAAAALDSRSVIFDSVTGLPGGDMRGIRAYLPDITGTFSSSLPFEARALGGAQGTSLQGVEFNVESLNSGGPITTESYDFTLSSAANMDIRLLSPTFRGVHTSADGTVDGVVYSYGIGILADHPTRTGTDAFKGAAPIEDDFTFDIDLSGVSAGAQIFDWGASLGANSEFGSDGIARNYERFTRLSGSTSTLWSQSNRPAGQVDEVPGNAVWSTDRATPDSGDWNITNNSGSTYEVQVSGSDTTGSTFPNRYGGGGVIPASDKWFASGQMHVWIPIDDILPGDDGIAGNADDGALEITAAITNFDPDDAFGITNNFGAGVEDPDNNDYTFTVVSFSLGGSTKYNSRAGHPTSGRWVETSTVWNAGDGETSLGHVYDQRVSSGRNLGVLGLDGIIFGDKFDNTSTKIIANSLQSRSGDGWSRIYSSGGPTNGTFLTYGTDYIIEFGTGGVNGDPAGWTDWDSMGDATLADDQTSTVWTQDPTDAALGGTADPVTGVSDAITKYRIKLLRDLNPGESVISLVTVETTSKSTLDLANNPGGLIAANFVASTAAYREGTATEWITSEYNPADNRWFAGGSGGHIARGDRLYIVEANADVDKTVVDLGAGNSYLAGTQATFELTGTITIPGPDSGAPAVDVYVTDILPPGLTVVGGTVSPPAGFSYTAGDGSTQSVQAVEYFDGTNWSTTFTYGATGVRWFYGDVPLNTILPKMQFDVLVPFDAQNGDAFTNTAVISTPTDESPEDLRNSSAGIVAVQIAALSAGKFVVTPLVPEDTDIVYELGVANVSDDRVVPYVDLVDLLPYNGDFEGSDYQGGYTFVDVTSLDPGLTVWVTTADAATLDSQDGTVDGLADPGNPGDATYVAEGTGIWQYTLDDVQNGVAGAPAFADLTGIRITTDKTIDPYLPPGESFSVFLHLTPDGNRGIPSDTYINSFIARTDPAALPLPVSSAAVTARVVAPDIEIEKEVALDEAGVNIDPTDDSHWGETVNFDDTDKAYFRLKVTNTGTADFLDAMVVDNLPAGATYVSGSAMASTGDVSGFPADWTFNLAAGATAYLVYQVDVNDAGNYVNTADVTATDTWGETVVDADDAEANFVTEISAAKQQTGAVRSTSNPDVFEVTYEVEVLNSSIFDLSNLTLTEDLIGAFGPGFQGIDVAPQITSSTISAGGTAPTINGGFDGDADDQILNADGLLRPDDSVTITYTVLVDPLLLTDPANTVNQVEAGGLTGGPGGAPTTDLSDDGDDADSDNPGTRGDTGGTDDPTPLALPAIDLTKEIVGTPTPAASGVNGNFDVTYEFELTNTGTVDLDNIALTEDFLANLGSAYVGIVSGPLVTMTTATDTPDLNFDYDGGTTDPDVFNNTPQVDTFTYGGSTSNTTNRALYTGDNRIVVDPNQEYELSVDAFAGDGAGGGIDPSARHYLGFISYDVDGNVVNPYSYAKFAGSTDTTLAAPLNPGDTTITLTNASGWSNAGGNHTRTIAWYGYTDSTGYTHPDYTYTRNYLANAWPPGAVSGNTITLNTPWAGPALNAGDAVRNSTSGGSYQYVLLSAGAVPGTPTNYTSQIGDGFIANGQLGTTMFRPGTHSISSLVLADWVGGGTGTQLTVDNFQLTAPNMNLLESGQKVTFQITVEIDPDAPGAIYDGVTGDGNNTLENQATITAEDPWNDLPVSDTSDDPTDPTDDEYGDDSDPDDPTSLALPSIELTKELVGLPVASASGTFGNFDATYEFVLTNNGNDDLQMLSLLEDFQTQFGGAFVQIVPQGGAPAAVTATSATDPVEINSNYDGNSDTEIFNNTGGNTNLLEMGQSITIQIIVEVDPDAAGANYTGGQLLNIATVAGTGVESGLVTDDESDDTQDDSDVDPDGDNSPDDPTPLYIPSISLTKDAGDAVANGDNWDITFTKVVKNTGTTTLTNLQLIDDVASQFGNAYVSASGLAVQNFVGAGTIPTANAPWTGDNSLTMLNGGVLEIGDQFEVVFTITIDPDGIDSVSQALENQSVVTGDALDQNGDPLLDDAGDPVSVSDDSDNGTDPDSENGEDDMDGVAGNDPTPIIIADIGVSKEVFGTPVMLANGNFEVVYELVVENTGTVNLADLTLGEDLATQFGPAYVDAYNLLLTTPPANAGSNVVLDSANWDGDTSTEIVNTAIPSVLVVGDSFVFQFTVEVDPDATGTSMALDNQVTATGDGVDDAGNPLTDSNGDPVVATDDSDSGTDPSETNTGEPGDTGGSDDPTPLNLPAVSLAKSAGDAVPNGDDFDVTFTFVYENTGTTQLTNLELLDDIATEFGNAYVSASGLAVQNFAGTGTSPTANAAWTGDTTLNMISGGTLEIGDSFEVVFTVTIDPDGVDSVSQGLENQGTANADGIDNDGDPIAVTDESDNGVDPNGENGEDDGDGTFANDPTPIIIADISVTKEVSGTPVKLPNDNFSVTYQLVVENTGTVDLANLSLVDDLANQFGGAFVNAGSLTLVAGPFAVGSAVVLDSVNWDGDANTEMINQVVPSSLVVGDSYIVQFTVEVDPDATGTSGPMDNQVTTGGDAVDSAGNPINDSTGTPITTTDDSDSGTDPSSDNPGAPGDMGTSDDPTPLALPDLAVGKQANSVTVATDGAGNELTGSFDVQYLVVLENTGTIELTNLQLLDDLTTISTFGDAYDPTLLSGPTDRSGFITAPAIVSHTLANPGDLPNLNAGFLGGGAQTGLFDGTSGALQTGEQIVISFTVRIDSDELLDGDATDGMAQNQVQGTADSEAGPVDDLSDDGLNPNGDNGDGGSDDPTPFQVPQVRLYKSHSDAIDNGDGTSTITVTLRVDNSGTVDLASLTLTEDLASQFGAAFISTTTPVIDATGASGSNIPANLVNPAWAGDTSQDLFDPAVTNETLIAGDEFLITFDVVVDPDLLDDDSDYLENTATVTGDGTNFDGTTITVSDDSGADNGTGIDQDEPTSAIVPEIAIAKTAGDAIANGDNWDVPFTLVIENTGSVNLDMLTLFDDVAAQFGPAYVAASGLTLQNFVGGGTAPTLNTAWEADNALTMVTGGLLEPGDRFEVTFVITIDPDGIDSISQVLDNQAEVNGRGVDQMGDPLTDSTGNPLLADDLSDDGTDPNGTNPGENGDEGTNDDPTPIVIADVGLAKTILGTPVLLANGNYAVTYELVAENIGTTDLAGLSLTDDLSTQFGAAFVNVSGLTLSTPPSDPSSTLAINTGWDGTSATDMIDIAAPSLLAVGDSYAVQFVVEIDAVAATGNLDNQAVTGGDAVDPDGNPYTDSSGDPITAEDDSDSGTDAGDPNADQPGDTGTTDDPTPLYIPSVGLAKLAGDAVANGENFDVTFTLVYENNGTVDLTNLTLIDDIAAQFGNAYVSVTGLTVQNFAGTGTPPTANAAWETDTTQSMITGGTANIDDTFEVVFTVTIDPDGIDNVSQPLENQATATGEALDENGDPITDAAGDPVTATDDSDNGTDPNEENGEDDGDGTFGNDPTPIIIADVSVVKDIVGTPTALDNGNFEVTYELIIENTGTVDLANLSLVDALPPQFGSVFVSAGNVTLVTPPADATSNVVLDSGWDGDAITEMIDQGAVTLLAVGDSYVVRFTAEVDPDALLAPPTPIENQVTTGGDAVDENGDPIQDSSGDDITATDLSDDGTDPNGDNAGSPGDHGTTDDPTPLLIPDVGLAKVAGDAVPNGDNFDVTFTLVYTNTGTVALDNLVLIDDVAAQFGNAFVSTGNITIQNFAGTGTAPVPNGNWKTDTTQDMLVFGNLDVGDSFEVVFTVTIDPDGLDSMSQALDNQAVATADGLNDDGTKLLDDDGDVVTATDDSDDGTDVSGENDTDDGDGVVGNDPTPIIIADIAVAKEAVGSPVQLANGDFEVVYQLVIENTGTVDLANLSLVEDLATQYGNVFVSASGLTLVSGPTDPTSSVVIDPAFNGGSSTEMIDQAAATYLAVGDSYTLQFTTVVDPSLVVGPLTNQVTTTGDATDEDGPILDSNGDPIVATDDSDSGAEPSDTNPDEPGDTGTSDDPTPLQVPSVGLAKLSGDPVINGDNWDVTFTLVYENNGTVDLNNLTLTDDIAAQFGNAFVSASGLTVQNFSGTGTAPTANAAWESDTSASMITGGQANIGDTFEVVFTVTIDPDGIDNASQSLENQAVATGDGLDDNGDPILDDAGDPVVATDDSDNGTDPDGENGEDDGDGTFANDPTPIYIADIAVAKEVVGTPSALLNGNFEVTYQLVIENTGTVDLANLTLVEDLATQFGAPLVTAGNATIVTAPTDPASNIVLNPAWDGASVTDMIDPSAATFLAIGDSYIVRFTVEVDLDAGGTSGPLDNQVVTGGDGVDGNGDPIVDSNGTPITATDDSDSGTDVNGTNPDQPGDTGNSDDPTPLLIPDVGLSKSAGDAVANGDNFDVTFRLKYENTGTTVLNNLSIVDDVQTRFGNAFVSTTGLFIGNFSGTGIAPIVNGNWPLLTSANMLIGGELQPGDSFDVVFKVTIDPDGVDGTSQNIVNQAEATGEYPGPDGTPTTVNDLSDDGTDPNGDDITGNDPTQIVIADLGIAKSIVGEPVLEANGNYSVTYQVVVENTGTVDLASMSLIEDLQTQFAAAYVNAGGLTLTVTPTNAGSNIAVDSSGFNGGSSTEILDQTINNVLMVGDSFTIEFTAEIDPLVVTSALLNQVQGAGDAVDANGDPINGADGNPVVADDLSDSGTDPNGSNPDGDGDNNTSDDPTPYVPESLDLADVSGTVFVDSNNNGVYDPGETGIEGVEVTLIGTDIYGNAVELTVLTDAQGNYSFTDLNPGEYRLIEAQPDGYDDGGDEANVAFSVGNDEVNDIILGFGDSFGGNNFGEQLQGTSGNPSRLPPFLPFNAERLSNRISGLLGGPGPVYSGVPIASNGNPLTLDSGRPVTGGYASEFATADAVGDCGCPEVVETPCDVPVTEQVVEEVVEDCGVCEEVVETATECECQVCEEPVACEQCTDCGNCCDCGSVNQRSGFLFRFKNWLSR